MQDNMQQSNNISAQKVKTLVTALYCIELLILIPFNFLLSAGMVDLYNSYAIIKALNLANVSNFCLEEWRYFTFIVGTLIIFITITLLYKLNLWCIKNRPNLVGVVSIISCVVMLFVGFIPNRSGDLFYYGEFEHENSGGGFDIDTHGGYDIDVHDK